MPVRPLVAAILAVALAAPSPSSAARRSANAPGSAAAGVSAEAKKLKHLLDLVWEETLKENPLFATIVGDGRYDDRWPDLSAAGVAAWKRRPAAALEAASRIDRARLSDEDRLNLDILVAGLRYDAELRRFPEETLLLDQIDGVHRWAAMAGEISPARGARDYANLVARLRAYPRVVDQAIVLLRQGLERGATPPRHLAARLPEVIGAQLADDPRKAAVFHAAFERFPASLGADERARIEGEVSAAVSEAVLPALRKLHAFVTETYAPRARTSMGLSAVPDGAAWYAARVRASTTTSYDPEALHRIGLDEVARIRKEMEAIRAATGFEGDLPAFFQFMRTDERFFHTDGEALLTQYRDVAKRVDAELPRLFGRLPRLPFGIVAEPAHSEKTSPAARYMLGSTESAMAGRVYVNTYEISSRPKWDVESTELHEGAPGHHMQIQLAAEQKELHPLRRWAPWFGAYVEGWGLYAESLGKELGLYRDPYSDMGRLSNEMMRAIRLVLDTGIHAKGWTREQAIAFFEANSPSPRHDIEVEVDRYTVWPAQALMYKTGELALKALRARAKEALGERFDVRAFHDLVLGGGALPLDVLEARVDGWIARTRSAGATKAEAGAPDGARLPSSPARKARVSGRGR